MHPKTIELQARTRKFAAAVITFCDRLPKDGSTQRIVLQLVDSSGATDSNYRAACRARSKAEFIAKLGVALEEADESKGWLQLLVASNRVSIDHARDLIQEADEFTSIFAKSASPLSAGSVIANRKKDRRESRGHAVRDSFDHQSPICNPSICNLQSAIRRSAICNPSICNLQSTICNGAMSD